MDDQNIQIENLKDVFISILSLLLLGLLLYSSKNILSPILIYILILIFYLINKKLQFVWSVFILSTIVFFVWFLNELLILLIPFLLCFVFAYLMNPFVQYLEKRKIPRFWGTFISIFLLILFFSSFMAFIIPNFIEQVGLLISTADEKVSTFSNFFNQTILPELNRISVMYPELKKFLSIELPTRLHTLINEILQSILQLIGGMSKVFSQILNLIIVPVLTFYFLKDFEKILDAFLKLFNKENQLKLINLSKRIDTIWGSYIRGFLTISFINGVVITTGLTILNIPYALVLGLLSGLLNLIPYFGVIISLTIGFLVSVFSGIVGIKLILVPLIYLFENVIESSIIVPKIIGERVGLHPLLILLAIIVFGFFGGIFGMLISVPVTALLISFLAERKYS